jgi:hypothetical protein
MVLGTDQSLYTSKLPPIIWNEKIASSKKLVCKIGWILISLEGSGSSIDH